jgi:hypothetical protein
MLVGVHEPTRILAWHDKHLKKDETKPIAAVR